MVRKLVLLTIFVVGFLMATSIVAYAQSGDSSGGDTFIDFLKVAGAIPLLIRGAIEFVRRAVDPKSKWPSFTWPVLAFVIGVVGCLVYGFNYISSLVINGQAPHGFTGTSGQVLTGLILGGLALAWNTPLAHIQVSTKAKAGVTPDGSPELPQVAQK